MTEPSDDLHLPLVEERVSVRKRAVETDRVRVRTIVETHDALIEETLRSGHLHVERVPVERAVTHAPAPYDEGDVLVIPIVEERLVVEKRLFVVEELRITRTAVDEAITLSVPLRRTRAVVERDVTDLSTNGRD